MKELDKYKGCLIGGAVGDTLGYPVEFMSAVFLAVMASVGLSIMSCPMDGRWFQMIRR